MDLPDDAKVKISDFPQFSIRVAYQVPVAIKLEANKTATEALPSTFEDALSLENIELFKVIDGGKLITSIKEILSSPPDIAALSEKISNEIRETKGKAEFALDLLTIKQDLAKLKIPRYIEDGLKWLELQLDQNQRVLLPSTPSSESFALTSNDAPVPKASAAI